MIPVVFNQRSRPESPRDERLNAQVSVYLRSLLCTFLNTGAYPLAAVVSAHDVTLAPQSKFLFVIRLYPRAVAERIVTIGLQSLRIGRDLVRNDLALRLHDCVGFDVDTLVRFTAGRSQKAATLS